MLWGDENPRSRSDPRVAELLGMQKKVTGEHSFVRESEAVSLSVYADGKVVYWSLQQRGDGGFRFRSQPDQKGISSSSMSISGSVGSGAAAGWARVTGAARCG